MNEKSHATLLAVSASLGLIATNLMMSQEEPQSRYKVGFINTTQIVYQTQEGRLELEKVKEFVSKKQAEYKELQEELAQLTEHYAAQRPALNAEARLEMERKLEEKQRDLTRWEEDYQTLSTRRQQEVLDKLAVKAAEIMPRYARDNGYTAILPRTGAEPYIAPEVDITKDFFRLYDREFPAANESNSVQ